MEQEEGSPAFPWERREDFCPSSLTDGSPECSIHAGGIITPPIILAGAAYGDFTAQEQQYLVSAALIVSSIASFIQVTQFKIPFTRCVIAQQVILTLRYCTRHGVPCTIGLGGLGGTCEGCSSGLVGTCKREHVLGTTIDNCLVWAQILVTCWFQVALSFCSPRHLEKIFPPVVTGPTVILIGVALITTGIEQWGGGTYCASQMLRVRVLTSRVRCTGNGDVILPFGHKFYLGLGLVVFFTLLLVELFGSPFMRNTQIVIGFVVGGCGRRISAHYHARCQWCSPQGQVLSLIDQCKELCLPMV